MRRITGDGLVTGREPLRHGFSLAELMIALAILGFGLLVIGAALPIGLRYTRDSIDMGTGDNAIQYAFSVFESEIRVSGKVERDPLYRPRYPKDRIRNESPLWTRMEDQASGYYEPRVKVWPLVAQAINVSPGPDFGTEFDGIATKVTMMGHLQSLIDTWYPYNDGSIIRRINNVDSRWMLPALPSVATVYPPISNDLGPRGLNEFSPSYYFGLPPNERAKRRQVTTPPDGSETRKAIERRVVWNLLYRNVPGREPGRDSIIGNFNDYRVDRNVYEVIAIASRLPSPQHRFPLQDPGVAFGGGAQQYQGIVATHTPVPWLLAFEEIKQPVEGKDYDTNVDPASPNYGERVLRSNFRDPGTWEFKISPDLSGLLPVGSIFIPALNDDLPVGFNDQTQANSTDFLKAVDARRSGFVPHAAEITPIYEVVKRPDEETVIVKTNGYYPWVDPRITNKRDQGLHWPVWVIPPATEEQTEAAMPIFERRSPVLSVARRFIQVREIE